MENAKEERWWMRTQQTRAVRPQQKASSLERKKRFWGLEKRSCHKLLWLASISSVKRQRKSRTSSMERVGIIHAKIKRTTVEKTCKVDNRQGPARVRKQDSAENPMD